MDALEAFKEFTKDGCCSDFGEWIKQAHNLAGELRETKEELSRMFNAAMKIALERTDAKLGLMVAEENLARMTKPYNIYNSVVDDVRARLNGYHSERPNPDCRICEKNKQVINRATKKMPEKYGKAK